MYIVKWVENGARKSETYASLAGAEKRAKVLRLTKGCWAVEVHSLN